MTTHEHKLAGCRAVPLAHYLKALGVLRLVNEQVDAKARGFWRNDTFVLLTKLDRDELQRFFLADYEPTPIIAPWNGGSGFFPKDNRQAFESIQASTVKRLQRYKEVLSIAERVLAELGVEEKASGPKKAVLLDALRGRVPDDALVWLDAAFVLSNKGPKYPPLLGTGGNDGRLDFTNNFMQRLVDVLDPGGESGRAEALVLLRASLFDEPADALSNTAVGQFLPSSAGGANAGTGFDGPAVVNAWDFVLMLEGAVMFAAAAVRRLETETSGALSYPFAVRQAGIGYGSAAFDDEKSARAEMWVPLWGRPTTARELRSLLSEGRARIGRRTARNGVDFARAVASLGVDRGIEAFQRYGFQVRNGLAYLAVPLQRITVRREPKAMLLQEIDEWIDSFRRRASGDTAPASVRRALRQLEATIFALCTRGDPLRVQEVLIALGACEHAMAQSFRWTTEKSYTRPVPALSPAWLPDADDGSVELRLAASLASIRGSLGKEQFWLRQHLEPIALPIRKKGSKALDPRWADTPDRNVVWAPGHAVDLLNAILARRLVRATQSGVTAYSDRGLWAYLGDVADFIEGRVDEARFIDLVWGCALLDWPRVDPKSHALGQRREPRTPLPGAFYSLLKLCFAGAKIPRRKRTDGVDVPLEPRIHRLAAAGKGDAAAEHAIRRLRGCDLVPAFRALDVRGDAARRAAAALLFPVGPRGLEHLTLVLRPDRQRGDEADAEHTHQEGATA